ncbi:MAG: hypothetical protein GC159_10925 [Phycisphaera sp.]|nr:hypothetical protein [Phycisphaera sp.]
MGRRTHVGAGDQACDEVEESLDRFFVLGGRFCTQTGRLVLYRIALLQWLLRVNALGVFDGGPPRISRLVEQACGT